MSYLLDTCVVSELVKPNPNPKVISWVNSRHEEDIFLSSITIGEIQKGISRLPESSKKDELQEWLERQLIERFHRRVLGIDLKVARKWGEIQALSEKSGVKMPVIDSLIASIGVVYNLTVVTRNTRDMEASGVGLFNPWE